MLLKQSSTITIIYFYILLLKVDLFSKFKDVSEQMPPLEESLKSEPELQ